jgi:integrase
MARANGKDRGIFERPKGSNVWWCRYNDANGNERREKVGTKSAAKALYQKRKVAIRSGEKLPELIKARAYSFAEMVKEAVLWSKANKASWKDDEERLAPLEATFGARAANDIEASEFEVFLDELQDERELTGATINRYRAALQMAYREARRRGRVKNNPARDIAPRANSRNVIRFLSDEEERRLVASIFRPEFKVELYFALLTGARRGEQYAVRWEDIDLPNRTITLNKTKNGDPRQIELHKNLVAMLEMVTHDPSGFLFRQGRVHGNYRLTWFEDACKRANVLNFRWHDLRHTFASRLVMAGNDIARVQRAMGHKTISMTMRYAHLRQDHVREAIDTLAPVTLADALPKEVVN